MAAAVACVIIEHESAYAWLGHETILQLTLARLRAVRGLGDVVCCASAKLARRAGPDARLTLPRWLRAEDLPLWLQTGGGPAAVSDALVVVRPAHPFLAAAKIELCLGHVLDGGCEVAAPARLVTSDGRTLELPVPGVLAARRGLAALPAAAWRRRLVPVDLVEALDVRDPVERRVAEALAAHGVL